MIYLVRSIQFLLLVACTLSLSLRTNSQEPTLADVLASSPDRPNALLYMDTPLVRKFVTGTPLFTELPEKLGEVRIASELDIKTLEPTWEVGYVTVSGIPDASLLATSVGGYVDTIAGKTVVWSPRKSYLVPMPGGVLGLVRPSDRKLASRWLNKETSGGGVSYLQKQAAQGTKFISVLLAIDLEDVWSPITIKQRLEALESLKSADKNAIAATLSTIKGIRVIVSKKNLEESIISLDFGTSPSGLLPVAKAFFVEVLARNHSAIPEASTWTPSVDGNTLSFRGKIAPETLDDLLGIFTLHGQVDQASSSNDSSSANKSAEAKAVAVAKTYFDKTASIVSRVKDYSATNSGDRAQWNGRMAKRLDDLPTLNVDPALVDYSTKVSQALRGNMVNIQQTNIAGGTNAIVNSGVSAYGNPYNGYYYDVNSPYQYLASARGQAYSSYREVIAQIEEMERTIRREMTDKYQFQF